MAYALGVRGRRVLCVERDLSEPDRIVGELLQPGGVLALRSLGLETCVDGIDAQKVHGYAMYMDGKESKVEYPTDDLIIGRQSDLRKKEARKRKQNKEEAAAAADNG